MDAYGRSDYKPLTDDELLSMARAFLQASCNLLLDAIGKQVDQIAKKDPKADEQSLEDNCQSYLTNCKDAGPDYIVRLNKTLAPMSGQNPDEIPEYFEGPEY